MNIEKVPTELAGVFLFRPKIHRDSRGYFLETYHEEKYRQLGIDCRFVQDNLSHSTYNVLRGMHYQVRKPQAKLISALVGEIFDVAVDLRAGSPTRGKWTGHYLSADTQWQMYIPAGFAHGFLTISQEAMIHYKCSELYDPEDDVGVLWSDPSLAIHWPLREIPLLSEKDANLPVLRFQE